MNNWRHRNVVPYNFAQKKRVGYELKIYLVNVTFIEDPKFVHCIQKNIHKKNLINWISEDNLSIKTKIISLEVN